MVITSRACRALVPRSRASSTPPLAVVSLKATAVSQLLICSSRTDCQGLDMAFLLLLMVRLDRPTAAWCAAGRWDRSREPYPPSRESAVTMPRRQANLLG